MTEGSPDANDATRARDADRSLAIELIDAAYSDGQLSSSEREERCDRALAAETLGQLRRLTRDLQGPLVQSPARGRRRLVPVIVAVVVAIGIVAGIVIGTGDDDDPPPSQQQVHTVAPSPEPEQTQDADPPKNKPKPLTYSFTASGVRDFIRLYRKEFATTKATAFGFSPDQVIIARHGDTGQAEMWGYVDGHFVDDGYYSERDFEDGTIDIAKLDVEAAFRNLARVKRRVGDAKPRYLGMSVVVADGNRRVWLVAGDERTCEADWMTLDGTVRERGTPCPAGN